MQWLQHLRTWSGQAKINEMADEIASCSFEPVWQRVYPSVIGMSLEEQALAVNEHIRYVNFRMRGYMLLDITPERVQTDYWILDGVEADEGNQSRDRSFSVADGTNRLEEESMAVVDRPDAPAPAPDPPARSV